VAQHLSAEDRLAIGDVISRYCWAIDTGDVDAFVACFCEDGLLVWDAFDVPLHWRGAEALRHFASFLRDQPSTAGRQHHVTNLLVEPDGDGARGKAFVAVALRQGDGPHLLNVMGWYEDRFRREGEEWKIAERTIRDWSGPVLAGIAGQKGERVARPLPPPLAGLIFPGDES
jgi:ketosteroid isomerase-like protein